MAGCDQCQALMIQGIFCHETGCPNIHKVWDKEEERWVRLVKCSCGDWHYEGEDCTEEN